MLQRKIFLLAGIILTLLFLAACGNDTENSNTNDNEVVDENVTANASDNEEDDEEGPHYMNEYDRDSSESQEVAEQVKEALMTVDYNLLTEVASPTLMKQLNGEEDDDITDSNIELLEHFDADDSPKVPHGVTLHDEWYGFYRYDNFYEDDKKIFWYDVSVISPRSYEELEELSDSDFVITENLDVLLETSMEHYAFGIKRNEDGEFKVGAIKSSVTSFPIVDKVIGSQSYTEAVSEGIAIHELLSKEDAKFEFGDDSDMGF